MNDGLRKLRESVEQLTYLVRHNCEIAEAKVAEVNGHLFSAAKSGELGELCLLGPVMFECDQEEVAESTSAQRRIGQAALLAGWGVGVCWWNADDFRHAQQSEDLHSIAAVSFVPFDDCAPLTKSLLVPYLDALLQRLIDRLHG